MIGTSRAARAGIVIALLAGSSPATAQTPQPPARDPAAAEALFERGKDLVSQGRIADACAAFAESQRLDPAGGTLLRLALCHEAQGKLASAWVEFTEVARVSREGSGEPAKLRERVRIAQEHIAWLAPRIPRLVVSVAPAARVEGLRVTAGALPRDEGTWGVALPVDPGDVEIAATAPGRAPFHTTVPLAEAQQVTVDVPPLPSIPPPSNAVPPGASPASSPPPAATIWRPVGIAIGALGVVALGVGTYFGVRAIGKWNDASSVCPAASCNDPGAVSNASDARDAARVADFTLAGGVAALATGVVLYFVGAPRAIEPRAGGVAVSF